MAVNRVAYLPTVARATPSHGPYRAKKIYGGTTALTASDVSTINNTIQLFKVPAGFTLTDLHIEAGDLDTATTLTLSVGDSGTANRLLNASNIGQAGGKVDVLPAGVLGYRYPAETDIQLTVAAAATGQAASFTCFLEGFIDGV